MKQINVVFALIITGFFGSWVSTLTRIPGQPANSFGTGSNWGCNSGYRKLGN